MKKPTIKLAFRPQDDEFVHVYISTMDETGMFEIATLRQTIVEHHPHLFEKFKEFMKEAFAEVAKETGKVLDVNFMKEIKWDNN